MRLLLVEDDSMIGETVRLGLGKDGFTVDWIRDGESARTALSSETYDAVLLDLDGVVRHFDDQFVMDLHYDAGVLAALRQPVVANPLGLCFRRRRVGRKHDGSCMGWPCADLRK